MGELAEQNRRIYFQYTPEFLATGLQPSPFKLPAQAGLLEHADRDFGPLPGVFDDSLPDEFYVGISGIEGVNRFYDFDVRAAAAPGAR